MIEVDVAIRRGAFALDVAFTSEAGLTALFGRSGSGKSTVIAAVAGLLRPRRGRIAVGGRTLFDSARGVSVPLHRRGVGLVFQDGQLLPHRSVRQNLFYGRRFARARADEPEPGAVLDALGLQTLLDRRPADLSGGERQRVAIGRAVLARPALLLMDEPLASLDRPRKLEILPLIERLRDEVGIPILYVSHAVEEVARLAGEVVVLEDGRGGTAGPPEVALRARLNAGPVSADRFDIVSLLTARVRSHDAEYGLSVLDHAAGPITVPGHAGMMGRPVRVLVRGTDVSLATLRPEGLSLRTALAGRVQGCVLDGGPIARIDVLLEGGDLLAAAVTRKSLDELGLSAGTPVFALVKTASVEDGGGR